MGNRTNANDEVKEYLKKQQTNTGEKMEMPQELLDLANQVKQDQSERKKWGN